MFRPAYSRAGPGAKAMLSAVEPSLPFPAIPAGPAPTLGPQQGTTIYAMDVAQLSVGFTGSMIIGVHSGGGLTGVSNNVNYDVQHDGSASFNMFVTGDANGIDPPDSPNGFITPW